MDWQRLIENTTVSLLVLIAIALAVVKVARFLANEVIVPWRDRQFRLFDGILAEQKAMSDRWLQMAEWQREIAEDIRLLREWQVEREAGCTLQQTATVPVPRPRHRSTGPGPGGSQSQSEVPPSSSLPPRPLT